jgi:hypothetical protein
MMQPLLIPIFYEVVECYQLFEAWSFQAICVGMTVPQGFICDGASVPRILWGIKPPDGLHRAAAVAHDWLYANKGRFNFGTFSRKECDEVFRTLLIEAGVSRFQSWLMYRGVRLGGWATWRKPKNVRILPVRLSSPLQTTPNRSDEWAGHLYAP